MRNKRDYPVNWYDEIRPRILSRDKYKCTTCGISNRQWVAYKTKKDYIRIDKDEINDFKKEGYKVYQNFLHVCHLDNNKQNISDDNLITKCVRHHAKIDGNYKALLRKGYKKPAQIDLEDLIREVSLPPSLASLGRSDNNNATGL